MLQPRQPGQPGLGQLLPHLQPRAGPIHQNPALGSVFPARLFPIESTLARIQGVAPQGRTPKSQPHRCLKPLGQERPSNSQLLRASSGIGCGPCRLADTVLGRRSLQPQPVAVCPLLPAVYHPPSCYQTRVGKRGVRAFRSLSSPSRWQRPLVHSPREQKGLRPSVVLGAHLGRQLRKRSGQFRQ